MELILDTTLRLSRKTFLCLLAFAVFSNPGPLTASEDSGVIVASIESSTLSNEELKEVLESLGIRANEKINLGQLDSKLKTVFAEGKYENLFLDVEGKGNRKKLVISGNRLRKIRKVTFKGVDSATEEVLKREVDTREGKTASSKFLGQIREKLQKLLEQRGYYFSNIDVKKTESSDGKEVEIEVSVDKKQPTRIRKVTFKGVSEELEEELAEYITLAPGDVFSQEELNKNVESLNRYFRSNQYPTTRVDESNLALSQDKLSIDINILIKQGEKYQFQFAGNQVYPDVVLRELLSPEVLSQADAPTKIVALIESKYREIGYHFCQVKIENQVISSEKLNIVRFRIDEGAKVLIDRVDFNGGERLGQSLLRNWMYEEAPGVLARRIYWEGGLPELVQKLQKRMRREGYLSATLSAPRSVFSVDKKGVELIFEVEPGTRTFIQSIELEGSKSEFTENILEKFSLKVGDPLNLEKLDEMKAQIQSVYLRAGFVDVAVTGGFKNSEIIEVSQNQTSARIRFVVRSGMEFRVGKITIEGNSRTDTDVIERELQLKSGDKFDLEKLRASEDEISALGIFSRVEIVASTSPDNDNVRDVRVVVVENRRGFGEVGLGGAYEDPWFKLRTFVGLAYKNILGRNHTASVRTEVDTPFSRGDQLVPFLEYSGILGYRVPYPFTLPVVFSSSGGFDAYQSSAEVDNLSVTLQKRSKIEEKLEKKVNSFLTVLYRLHRFEHTRTESVTLKPRPTTAAPLPLTFEEDIGSTGPGFIFDFRDDIYNPTKGTYHTIDLEVANSNILSQFNFYMLSVKNSFYIPLPGSFGFTFFVGGGYASAYGDDLVLPRARLGYDLALGGPGSIRGYNLRTFQPQDFSQKAAYYNTRFELSIPIYPNISVAVFVDSGQLCSVTAGQGWKTDPRYDGAGIGFRYKTPVGPVVFDMAEGLTAPGKVVKFLFNIGTF